LLCRHLASEEDREEEVRLLVAAGADAALPNGVQLGSVCAVVFVTIAAGPELSVVLFSLTQQGARKGRVRDVS